MNKPQKIDPRNGNVDVAADLRLESEYPFWNTPSPSTIPESGLVVHRRLRIVPKVLLVLRTLHHQLPTPFLSRPKSVQEVEGVVQEIVVVVLLLQREVVLLLVEILVLQVEEELPQVLEVVLLAHEHQDLLLHRQ